MKIPMSTRLWLAWQVVRGRMTSAQWAGGAGEDATTIRFEGGEAYRRILPPGFRS